MRQCQIFCSWYVSHWPSKGTIEASIIHSGSAIFQRRETNCCILLILVVFTQAFLYSVLFAYSLMVRNLLLLGNDTISLRPSQQAIYKETNMRIERERREREGKREREKTPYWNKIHITRERIHHRLPPVKSRRSQYWKRSCSTYRIVSSHFIHIFSFFFLLFPLLVYLGLFSFVRTDGKLNKHRQVGGKKRRNIFQAYWIFQVSNQGPRMDWGGEPFYNFDECVSRSSEYRLPTNTANHVLLMKASRLRWLFTGAIEEGQLHGHIIGKEVVASAITTRKERNIEHRGNRNKGPETMARWYWIIQTSVRSRIVRWIP